MDEIDKVKRLGDEIGYGNLMHIASGLWRKLLESDGIESGAFIPVTRGMIDDNKEIQGIIDDYIYTNNKRIEEYLNN